jgi:hypothetical protein
MAASCKAGASCKARASWIVISKGEWSCMIAVIEPTDRSWVGRSRGIVIWAIQNRPMSHRSGNRYCLFVVLIFAWISKSAGWHRTPINYRVRDTMVHLSASVRRLKESQRVRLWKVAALPLSLLLGCALLLLEISHPWF